MKNFKDYISESFKVAKIPYGGPDLDVFFSKDGTLFAKYSTVQPLGRVQDDFDIKVESYQQFFRGKIADTIDIILEKDEGFLTGLADRAYESFRKDNDLYVKVKSLISKDREKISNLETGEMYQGLEFRNLLYEYLKNFIIEEINKDYSHLYLASELGIMDQ